MSWIENHKKSEQYASEKDYTLAATFELMALEHLDPRQQPRTYGITMTSAAWLYVKGGCPTTAKLLIKRYGSLCPAWAQEQLTELMEMIECDSTKS